MSRDDHAIRRDVQDHLCQVFCAEAEDGPSIRGNLPEVSEFGGKDLDNLQTGGKDESMNSSHLSPLGIDIAQFSRQDEPDSLILFLSAAESPLPNGSNFDRISAR